MKSTSSKQKLSLIHILTSPAGDSSYREFLEAAKELRASCEAIKLIKEMCIRDRVYIGGEDIDFRILFQKLASEDRKAKETIDNARDTFTRGK